MFSLSSLKHLQVWGFFAVPVAADLWVSIRCASDGYGVAKSSVWLKMRFVEFESGKTKVMWDSCCQQHAAGSKHLCVMCPPALEPVACMF